MSLLLQQLLYYQQTDVYQMLIIYTKWYMLGMQRSMEQDPCLEQVQGLRSRVLGQVWPPTHSMPFYDASGQWSSHLYLNTLAMRDPIHVVKQLIMGVEILSQLKYLLETKAPYEEKFCGSVHLNHPHAWEAESRQILNVCYCPS